jgi:hypothetical protein
MQTAPQTEKTADLRSVHTSNLVAYSCSDVYTRVAFWHMKNSNQEVYR